MAFTYGDDPNSTGTTTQKRDAVRFLSQDYVTGSMRATDAQVDFAITEEPNIYMAAARVAESIAIGLGGGLKRKRIGTAEVERHDPTHYQALATELRRRGRSHQMPFVGGRLVSDKDARKADTDNVKPFFTRADGQAPPIDSDPMRHEH